MKTILSNILYALKKVWLYDKLFFLFYGLGRPLEVFISIIGIYIPKIVIDAIEHKSNISNIVSIIIVFFALIFILEIISVFCRTRVYIRDFLIAHIHEIELLKKFMNTDYENTDDPKINNNYQYVMRDTRSGLPSVEFILMYFSILAQNIIGIVSYSAIIISLSPIVLILLVLSSFITYLTGKKEVDYIEKHKDNWTGIDRQKRFLETLSEKFDYIKDIKIYDMSRWITKMLKNLSEKKQVWNKKLEMRTFFISLINAIFSFVRDGCSYFILIYMFINGKINVGDFVFYFGAIITFSTWLKMLSRSVNEITKMSIVVGHYREYMNTPDRFNHGKGIAIPKTDISPIDIEFKNVYYKYPSSDTPTIKNLNLKINKGEKIAIVGENGAGKTTLIKLLCGLYYVTEGEILINGASIKDYNINEYYSMFSVVFQDIHLLPATIAEFIAAPCFGEAIDEVKLKSVIEKSGIANKINSLEKNIHTIPIKGIYKDTTDFSGGEKQKLMLARALYKDAPIVILDEPTAALDPIAESEIYDQYNSLTKNKTSLYISHRLASTRFCDRIIYIENGEISEIGTHDELLKLGGKYAHMYDLQSRYYKEEVLKIDENKFESIENNV